MQENGIDEGEAALYDRQIRLWGVEAQNRMRRASVLLVTVRGLASEVAKNLVLAGIGTLTLFDESLVVAQDLGSGYFFRESDIGVNRAEAAKSRLQELNPRVNVLAETSDGVFHNLDAYDLVCVTDGPIQSATRINELCRKAGKKMYASSSLGLGGYILADLIEHDFVIERAEKNATGDASDVKVPLQRHQRFVPLSDVVATSWCNADKPPRPKVLRRMLPLIELLAFLELQATGRDPSDHAALAAAVSASLKKHHCDPALTSVERLTLMANTWQHDFAPTCAVLGGVLAQDMLNALGGREAPLVNCFVLDPATNAGDIYALGGIVRATL